MKIVFFTLFIFISGILIFTYVKISQPEHISIPVIEKEEKRKQISSLPFDFNALNLPAREIYIKIDLRDLKRVILYKLSIVLKERYSLFNIREILDNYEIPYSLLQHNKKVIIYAVFRSYKEASYIFKLFKDYNLPVDIEKIEKRI